MDPMTTKTFAVEKYRLAQGYKLSATWGGISAKFRGYVACYGGDHRFIIYELTPDSPVPNPTYIVANKVGAIFVQPGELQFYIDLLRNERPVYAYLNDNKPEWNYLRTTNEPVGEEET